MIYPLGSLKAETGPNRHGATGVPSLVLASASPARLETLTRAGLSPRVIVSAIDEDAFTAADVPDLVGVLARAKAEAVAARLADDPETDSSDVLVVGCDSLLELDGKPLGKPENETQAIRRWRRMRGRTGHLHTGHHVIRLSARPGIASGVASTAITFASLTDAEIEAYVGTGEPLAVAGGFTIDGLGGAFVSGVQGDPHSVVGISLPLLRELFARLGVTWHSLWRLGVS